MPLVGMGQDWEVDLSGHLRIIGGGTSGHADELASHAHDPAREALGLQGLELGVSVRHERVELFANGLVFTDGLGDFDAEGEEAFVKLVDLPMEMEVRGGRFLNRFGLQNNVHLHGWDFVDGNLSVGNFLGEEGLFSDGVELSWFWEGDVTRAGFSLAGGEAVAHEAHGGEHAHGASAEMAYFEGGVVTARAFFDYRPNDFHQHRVGVNFGQGGNGFGRGTELVSGDYTYRWRENGFESGGREVILAVEGLMRRTEWVHEDDATITGITDQSSLMLRAGYAWNSEWRTDLRYGYVEGASEGPLLDMGMIEYGFEVEERKRLSLAVTRSFDLDDSWSGYGRVQWNHDELDGGVDEDSVWFQVGFDFGPGEVR